MCLTCWAHEVEVEFIIDTGCQVTILATTILNVCVQWIRWCAPDCGHVDVDWFRLQKLRNEDGMLALWYLLLGQFSVTFEYRPGAQHANADTTNASSVRGRIARFPRLTCRRPIEMSHRLLRNSLLPHPRWVSPWIWTYCRNCRVKLGWRPRCWTD